MMCQTGCPRSTTRQVDRDRGPWHEGLVTEDPATEAHSVRRLWDFRHHEDQRMGTLGLLPTDHSLTLTNVLSLPLSLGHFFSTSPLSPNLPLILHTHTRTRTHTPCPAHCLQPEESGNQKQ